MIKFHNLSTTQKEEIQTSTNINKVHSIPFILSNEGPARVADYFDAKIKEETIAPDSKNRTLYANSFHGRALKGCTAKLSKDIVGVVYERSVEKEVLYKPHGVFKELTYWKHDDLPMDSDKIPQITKFTQVLHDLHDD